MDEDDPVWPGFFGGEYEDDPFGIAAVLEDRPELSPATPPSFFLSSPDRDDKLLEVESEAPHSGEDEPPSEVEEPEAQEPGPWQEAYGLPSRPEWWHYWEERQAILPVPAPADDQSLEEQLRANLVLAECHRLAAMFLEILGIQGEEAFQQFLREHVNVPQQQQQQPAEEAEQPGDDNNDVQTPSASSLLPSGTLLYFEVGSGSVA
jgi:hypothetical protein